MKKIFGILNAYDHRNKGDRAIIETQISWITNKYPGCEIRIFSSSWKENANVFGVGNSFPPPISVNNNKANIFFALKPLFYTLMALARKKTNNQYFNECDAYFLCGGGYLYSSQFPLISRQLWSHIGNSLFAINSGKPVMQFPQSWGPISKILDRWICKKFAFRLDSISSRGGASTSMLSSWGVANKIIEIPDIVLAMGSLKPSIIKHAPEGDGNLGIAPIDYGFALKRSGDHLEIYINKIVKICEFYSSEKNEIILFPQVQVDGLDEDLPIVLRISEKLQVKHIKHRIVSHSSWSNYLDEMSKLSVFLGSRMHACIFSLISGVPTVGLSYQPKFEALFSQLNMQSNCFSINDFDENVVSELLIALRDNPASRHSALESVNIIAVDILSKLEKAYKNSRLSNLSIEEH